MKTHHLPTLKAARECPPLALAVLRQLGGGRDAIQLAIDAGNNGADGGFNGFTWSRDTVAFAKANRKAIAACLIDLAEDAGTDCVAFVREFNCLKDNVETRGVLAIAATLTNGECEEDVRDLILNALAWFALEEVGHALVNLIEGGGN